MAYFARRLEYAANDGDAGASFIALIEITRKKGGRAVGFFLYRYIVQFADKDEKFDMIRIQEPKTADEAREYWMFSEKNKYPGHYSPLWGKTSGWLGAVSVGGGYEQFPSGTWVKVCFPSPWKKRRKKKTLQVGNPAHILIMLEYQLCLMVEEKGGFQDDRSCLIYYDRETGGTDVLEENYPEYEELGREITSLEGEIDIVWRKMLNIKDEMRFKKARALGKPFFPRARDGSLTKDSVAAV